MNTFTKKNRDIEVLKDIFLKCPETGEKQIIKKIITTPESFVIETEGLQTKWRHTIKTEEI